VAKGRKDRGRKKKAWSRRYTDGVRLRMLRKKETISAAAFPNEKHGE